MRGFVGRRNIAVHANYCGNATAGDLDRNVQLPRWDSEKRLSTAPTCLPAFQMWTVRSRNGLSGQIAAARRRFRSEVR